MQQAAGYWGHGAYDLHITKSWNRQCKVAEGSESKADCSIKWDWKNLQG